MEYDDFLRVTADGPFEIAKIVGPDGVEREEPYLHVLSVDNEGRDAVTLMEIVKYALSQRPDIVERAANRLYWEKLENSGAVPKLSEKEEIPVIKHDYEAVIEEIKPDGRLRLSCADAPEHLHEVWAFRVDVSGLCVGQIGRAIYQRLPHRAGYMFVEKPNDA